MNIKGLPLLACLLLSLPAIAQKNFLPGYVINNGSDTLRGLIDYRSWEENPYRISFKTSTGIEQTYTVADLKGFVVEGKDKYERSDIERDMNLVTLRDLSYGSKDSTLKEMIFLRVLVEGDRISLYEFVDFKVHFFVKPHNANLEELTYKTSLHPQTGALVTNNGFRRQLQSYMVDPISNLNIQAASRLEYESTSLIKFVRGLNNSPTGFVAPDAGDKGLKSKFFAGAGVVMNKMRFSGADERLSSLQFNTTFSYVVGAGVDLYSPRNLQNLLFRLELIVSGNNASGSGTNTTPSPQDNTYTLKQVNITPAFTMLYNFIRSTAVKIYAGPGIAANISAYPEHLFVSTYQNNGNTYTYTDFPLLQKFWLAYYLRAGALINDKFDINLSWRLGGSFIEYQNIHENNHALFLKFNYRFGK